MAQFVNLGAVYRMLKLPPEASYLTHETKLNLMRLQGVIELGDLEATCIQDFEWSSSGPGILLILDFEVIETQCS